VQAIIYYITLPFIYLLSVLPFWMLYAKSNYLFFWLYYIIGYRKKVIIENLKKSFPEKSETEIFQITKAYYRHLCDVILESLKAYTISKKELKKRCKIRNIEVIEHFAQKGQSICIAMGHYGNWEWAGQRVSMDTHFKLLVIYRQIKNQYFNSFMQRLRSRFGAIPVEMRETIKSILFYKKNNVATATVFIADQTPPPENAYWINFLNQKTPVFKGTEKIAAKYNLPVIFGQIHKVKRGYYEIEFTLLCENTAELSEQELTQLHTQKLESYIKEKPEHWLWSHKRWKHKAPENL
jgi:Kdo2-lipid IVA lauroyltransferase/acyltransferase